MGLIAKAIRKLDKRENPPGEQETPPQPKSKKRLLILAVALLLVGSCFGVGYLLLLKANPEVPPRAAHRPTSTKNRAHKLPGTGSEADSAKAALRAESEKKEAKSEKAAEKSGVPEQTTGKAETVPKRVAKTSTGEEELSAPASGSQILPAEEQERIEEPEIEEQTELPPLPFKEDEETLTPTGSFEEKKQESVQYTADEIAATEQEEILSQEIAPSYPLDLRNELAQKTLTVTERSESRAQRYYNKGVVYQLQGQVGRAIDSYESALAFNADHVQAHINLATAYLQTQRYKEAEQELIYVYALRPKDPQILFNFGLLLYQTGEYSSAETKLKKLLELEPLHLEANLLLAGVYEEKGELSRAVEFCLRAYQINSSDPCVLYRLGRAWDKAGEPAKAAEHYRSFLDKSTEKEKVLNGVVRDRLDYLDSRGEKK